MKMQNAILGLVLLVLVACNASDGTSPNLKGKWGDDDPIIQIIPSTPSCFFLFFDTDIQFDFETSEAPYFSLRPRFHRFRSRLMPP
jgi:hypothetical protein